MMMKIAQKCNLQLLPLPGMLCPMNATVFLVVFCFIRSFGQVCRELTCIFSAEFALILVQVFSALC